MNPNTNISNSIHFGIVGLGRIADYQLKALEKTSSLILSAACDTDKEKASKLPADVNFYHHLDNFINHADLDAVLIATPHTSHYSIAKQAIQSGMHVLVEKPATTDMAQFNELADLAKRQEVLLSVAFHAAHANDLLWFKKAYAENQLNDLGPIKGFRCGFYDPYIQGNVLDSRAETLGGSWTDSGINALSVVGELIDIDSLTFVDSNLTKIPFFNCSEIQGTSHYTFLCRDGTTGRGCIDTNWTLELNRKFTELYFNTGTILLDHSSQKVFISHTDNSTHTLADFSDTGDRLVQHYMGVFDDFVKRFSEDKDNVEHARKLHDFLFKPYASLTS